MSKADVVGAGGLGLLAVSFWTTPGNRDTVGGAFSSAPAKQAAARKLIVKYAGALLGIGIAVLISGQSDSAATAFLAVLAALFLVWAMTHYGTQTKASTTTPATQRIYA